MKTRAFVLTLLSLFLALPAIPSGNLEDPPRFVRSWGSVGTGPGQMRYPYGLAVDSQGNVWVADRLNHRIQQFSSDGAFLRSIGSFGFDPTQFYEPTGIAIAPDGSILVTNYGDGRVKVFEPSGEFRLELPGEFVRPMGITVDQGGSIYVTDNGSRIQKFTSNGELLASWGSDGSGPGQFRMVTGVVADRTGNIYAADTFNGRIQRFTSNGAYSGEWPTSPDPYYIAIDGRNNIYITDNEMNLAQKYSPEGKLLTEWGASGTQNGYFRSPSGIAIGPDGSIYVADPSVVAPPGHARIQKFAPGTPVPIRPTSWGNIKSRYR